MALDYRAISIGECRVKVLIVMGFCIAPEYRGIVIGAKMLNTLVRYAEGNLIDFVILTAEESELTGCEGFNHCKAVASWTWQRRIIVARRVPGKVLNAQL